MEQQLQQQHPFHDFAHIKEIDLAGNLLCDWVQVWTIMNQFPNLEHFSIAYNYVRDDNHSLFLSTGMTTTTTTTGTITSDLMQILNLNHCAITRFVTIQWIADTMPNLTSLCIGQK